VPDTFNYVKAYHHVKFFRSDLQGKCDSMYYSFKDSTLEFIGSPVLWAQGNQMTSEYMKIFIKNKEMNRMDLNNSAFIVSKAKEDTGKFDQIKGRNMVGYFEKNNLRRMLVKGNGQMIVFHKDRGDIIGVQKTESSDIKLFFKKNKEEKLDLDRVIYINSVVGSFHPPTELKGSDLLLKDFIWLEKYRPRTWPEIFTW